MRLLDLIYLSFEDFKNRKMRVAFTTLGVSVAIGAVLFLVSLGFGLQKTLLEKITTEKSLLSLDIVSADDRVISLTPEVLKEISNIPQVEEVCPQAIFSGQVSLGKIMSEANLNLVGNDYFDLSGIFPDIGRAFNNNDSQKIVVNSAVAQLFNLAPQELVGKKIRIVMYLPQNKTSPEVSIYNIDKDFEIVGIIKEQNTAPQIFINKNDLKNLSIKEYQFAKVKVKTDKDIEKVRELLISKGFTVSALSDTINQANKIFRIIQIILGFFGIIALIVAAIGMINTMTITLLERTNDIGIMRAIGAAPGDIKWIFLSESILTGLLGGLGGIGLGIGSGYLFNWLINILARALGGKTVNIFYYPLWFILFILLLSVFVGLFAGTWPARRASRLDPLKALKYK